MSKLYYAILFSFIILIGIFFSPLKANSSFPPGYEQNIDALLEQSVSSDEPGVLVMVMEGDNVDYIGQRGLASIEHNTSINKNTQFRLASLSKPFTSYAIFLLESQGKLKTTDPISNYIADTPVSWRKLTINDLIYNQTGINDIFSLISIKHNGYEHAAETFEESINIILKQEKLNTINRSKPMLYSNSNYMLLAHIIEQTTEQSFASWMSANVFKPLGMRSTYIFEKERTASEQLASGYWIKDEQWEATHHHYEFHGATGVISTAQDLSRWFSHLHDDRNTIIAKQLQVPSTHNFSGGFFTYLGGGDTPLTLYMHGRVLGYTSSFYLNRDSNSTIMTFSLNENIQSLDFMDNIQDAIWYEKLPQPKPLPASSPISLDELALYKGSYLGTVSNETDLETNYFVQIDVINDQLYEVGDTDKYRLEPVGYFQFRSANNPSMQLSFYNEQSGQVMSGFKVYGNTYKRVSTNVSEFLLKGIEGRYRSDSLATEFNVTVENGKVTLSHSTANKHFELFTVEGDKMYSHMLAGSNIQLIWEEDKVIALSLSDARAANVEFVRVD